MTKHKFTAPPGRPWDVCTACGLGRAAHKGSAGGTYKTKARKYRCPDCVTKGVKVCRHKAKRDERTNRP